MGEKLYFPLFVDLSEKNILIVGAGRIALRRIQTMVDFAGTVKVVAPQIHSSILELAETSCHLELLHRDYQEADLDGADMVFAATNDPELNRIIALTCHERGILVNDAHDRQLCDFYFPGLVRKDPLVIGVTACGKDHAAAKEATRKIRSLLG